MARFFSYLAVLVMGLSAVVVLSTSWHSPVHFNEVFSRAASVDHEEPRNDTLSKRALSPAQLLDLEKAVGDGKFFADLLDSDVRCQQPSTFVNDIQHATTLWGWTLQMTERIYTDNDQRMAPYFEDPVHTILQRQFWQHTRQTTVDGKTYRPTFAKNDGCYKEGWIFAMDNSSPEKNGPKLNPPNMGPYPQLSRWSDIVFLQYQSLYSSATDLLGVSAPLENVVRGFVVDPTSFKIIDYMRREYLGLPNTLDSAGYPVWPGIALPYGSRQFYAMLGMLPHTYNRLGLDAKFFAGIPNGKGVVYLLSQHRQDLGHKCIREIQIFWHEPDPNDAAYNRETSSIWYKIGDAPCGPPGVSRKRLAVESPSLQNSSLAGDEIFEELTSSSWIG